MEERQELSKKKYLSLQYVGKRQNAPLGSALKLAAKSREPCVPGQSWKPKSELSKPLGLSTALAGFDKLNLRAAAGPQH